MKDPVRLLDGEASDAERVLLRAGAHEEPPIDGALRLAAVLGVSAAVLDAAKAAASAPVQAAAAASTPPGAAAAAAPLGAGLALKWLALAGGATAITAAALLIRGGAPRPPAVDEGRPQSSVAAPEPSAGVEPQPAELAPAPKPSARETSAQPRPEPARARSKSIAREIEQLDAARDRLQRGQARAALAVLDAYRREHEGGVLGQEATLLRIEALVGAGERAAARRLAERFLRDNPRSPHEDRVRALVGDVDGR